MTKSAPSLAAAILHAPAPSDPGRAAERLADLMAEAEAEEVGPALKRLFKAHGKAEALVLALADHSPFLWGVIETEPARLLRVLETPPEQGRDRLLAAVHAAVEAAEATSDLMRDLRVLRAEFALLVALADIGGVWSVEEVTSALTAFADACVGAAVRWLLKEQADLGRFLPPDPHKPERDSGLVVLALGKHGAGELNYSSDIDIVVFFDPEAPAREGLEPSQLFFKLTQGIVRILQERTADGYVFRVDLRLRPDPGSTSVAVSLPAAFSYYENVGQNWERAAYIKARPIAGDVALGERFLKDLTPFIWRKYFDFATIADIHAMKRQIHVARGHEEIAVAGHDIKLGRGGIREIEFFVQTQQLVFGGRRPNLRGARTLDMLDALVADGWITAHARDELGAAYRFLRTVEHRLQMVADEQTQRLPEDAEELARFAMFCGFADVKAFGAALTAHARKVQEHYALLFEEGPDLASDAGSLVFTGSSDDPETLETLARMGFRHPPTVAETVRGWHFGRRPAVTSARARQTLTELTPALLTALGRTADPDGALAALDQAFGSMPAAVELLSMLRSNERLLQLFADFLGSAPRLAEIVSERPHVLDAVIDPAFAEPAPDMERLTQRLRRAIGEPASFEEFLDRVRDAARVETFVAGARLLSGVYAPARAGEAFSALAETVVDVCWDAVSREFIAEHGKVKGGRAAILGLGRLGAREMTASSDLDLVVIYDFDPDKPESAGGSGKPLHAAVYYTRLTQRLLSALTVPTRRGGLYEVDLRLRPEGRKGPVATQFEGFVAYQASEAETWEHMALTRARVVAGDKDFAPRAMDAIADVLRLKRDPKKLAKDVRAMRDLLAQEKGDGDPWDMKRMAGGLVDIDFIAQFLLLAHAAKHPDLIGLSTIGIIERAVALKLLSRDEAHALREAHHLMSGLIHWQRLTVEGYFDANEVAPAVFARIAMALGQPDVRMLETTLAEHRAAVRAIFEARIG